MGQGMSGSKNCVTSSMLRSRIGELMAPVHGRCLGGWVHRQGGGDADSVTARRCTVVARNGSGRVVQLE